MRADEGVRGERVTLGLVDLAGAEQRLGERPLGFAEPAVILAGGVDPDCLAERALRARSVTFDEVDPADDEPDQAASPAAPASRYSSRAPSSSSRASERRP